MKNKFLLIINQMPIKRKRNSIWLLIRIIFSPFLIFSFIIVSLITVMLGLLLSLFFEPNIMTVIIHDGKKRMAVYKMKNKNQWMKENNDGIKTKQRNQSVLWFGLAVILFHFSLVCSSPAIIFPFHNGVLMANQWCPLKTSTSCWHHWPSMNSWKGKACTSDLIYFSFY